MITTKLIGILAGLLLIAGLLLQPLSVLKAASETEAVSSTASESKSRLQRIESRGKLRVGVNPGFMPFSFIDKDGKRVGVDIQIGARLAEALGVEMKVVAPESFSGLIPMLIDDKIDVIIAGMSITLERVKQVSFTDAYFDTGMSILLNVGQTARLGVGNVKDADELISVLKSAGDEDKLKIAVTEGKAPQAEVQKLFPEATVVGYPSNEEAAEATFKGEANMMIHDEIFLKVWYQQNEDRVRFRMAVLDPPIKPDFYGIATAQGDQAWLQLLNVFVKELRVNNRVIDYLTEYLPNMRRDSMSDDARMIIDIGDME